MQSVADKIVRVIHAAPPLPQYKKVGVYARVSTRSPEQINSLSAQVSELVRMFRNVPLHTIYDVYIDVMSGAHTETRPAYQRMLDDCRNNNLDLIVCKSISRFGRNTEEMLKTVREIKQYGVNVYFQLENMNTSDSTAEHIMTVISAFREEENKSRRENVRRGIIQKAETGTSKYYTKPCYGYRRDENGELAIYEPEAANIRLIFDAYLQGATISQLLQLLEARQIPSPTGREKWCRRSVDQLLDNEKYVGDVLLMKTYTPEVGVKRRKNRGESYQYKMTDGHPPIIARDAFAAVQEEKRRRTNVEMIENVAKRTGKRYISTFCLSDYLDDISE